MVGEVLEVMKGPADEGMTMVVVTHEMGLRPGGGLPRPVHGRRTHSEQNEPHAFLPIRKEERTREFLSKVLWMQKQKRYARRGVPFVCVGLFGGDHIVIDRLTAGEQGDLGVGTTLGKELEGPSGPPSHRHPRRRRC